MQSEQEQCVLEQATSIVSPSQAILPRISLRYHRTST